MTGVTTADSDDRAPSTAVVERVLAAAAEVEIIEESPHDLASPDAKRLVVSGDEIADLVRVLAVVDGGNGDRCLCAGWPTIVVRDGAGRQVAQWTLHHQTAIRGLGNCDADLRDGSGLTDWLAERGLTGSREGQQMLADEVAGREKRRLAWVRAAPPPLTEAAEAASHWGNDEAVDRLVSLVAERYPDAVERIRTMLTWAGFPPRTSDGGVYWYESVPERLLLAEPNEAIFDALAFAPLTAAQLDGAAELFTSLEWTRPLRAEVPEQLRSQLIAHVTATGTGPMLFRMRHGYGAARSGD